LVVSITRPDESLPNMSEVVVDATLTPDPTRQPYSLRVSLSGVFVAPEGTESAEFETFCKKAAPVILWPYVRSLVSAVTTDAPFGPIRLDPLNMTAVLAEEGWKGGDPPSSRGAKE